MALRWKKVTKKRWSSRVEGHKVLLRSVGGAQYLCSANTEYDRFFMLQPKETIKNAQIKCERFVRKHLNA